MFNMFCNWIREKKEATRRKEEAWENFERECKRIKELNNKLHKEREIIDKSGDSENIVELLKEIELLEVLYPKSEMKKTIVVEGTNMVVCESKDLLISSLHYFLRRHKITIDQLKGHIKNKNKNKEIDNGK